MSCCTVIPSRSCQQLPTCWASGRCAMCSQALETGIFPVGDDGKPYHSDCHKQKFHPKCCVCKDFIPFQVSMLQQYASYASAVYGRGHDQVEGMIISLDPSAPIFHVQTQAAHKCSCQVSSAPLIVRQPSFSSHSSPSGMHSALAMFDIQTLQQRLRCSLQVCGNHDDGRKLVDDLKPA